MSLNTFPEELIEHILADALACSGPTSTSPICISHKFHRIAIPILYSHIQLGSPVQACCLLEAFHSQPSYSLYVRHLTFGGLFPGIGPLLRLCASSLKILDFSLDEETCRGESGLLRRHSAGRGHGYGAARSTGSKATDIHMFCESLQTLSGLKHLVIRKPSNVYLTMPAAMHVLSRLAVAASSWTELESAYLAFKLSSEQFVNGRGRPAGPVTSLIASLASLPRLHTFITQTPSLWSDTLLALSGDRVFGEGQIDGPTPRHIGSRSIEKVVLLPGNGFERSFRSPSSQASFWQAGGRGASHSPDSVGGLYMVGVAKHPKLAALVRAGSEVNTRVTELRTPTRKRAWSWAGNPDVCNEASQVRK